MSPFKPSVIVDVWSDYVCPYCFLEMPVLERIRSEHGSAVDIRWHAFELRPEPAPTLDPAGDYLKTTWARSVYPMAEERGMVLHLPPVQPRSRKAMEAAEFARDAGCFEAMHDALFRAFFEEGRDLASTDVLVAIGHAQGLDGHALRAALEQGTYTARVLHDQQEAQRLGIGGVPMMVVRRPDQPVHDGLALSGAQPLAAVARAVKRVLTED